MVVNREASRPAILRAATGVLLAVVGVSFASSASAQSGSATYETVVTATRAPLPVAEAPAAVTAIDRQDLDATPSKVIDEALRAVPGVGLFRRSSSVVADPSAQGLNLRGVGPSGVSRGLVLVDGVPATDAFGGWVYWRALPALSIERIEIVPGSGSALYGNSALGGIVHFITRPLARRELDFDATVGSEKTTLIAAHLSDRWRSWGAAIDGEFFRSDGYEVVGPASRGSIDHAANSDHATVNARVEGRVASRTTMFVSGGYFRERQDGGTTYSATNVQVGRYATGISSTLPRIGRIDATIYGHINEFDQQRPQVDSMRANATLALTQAVPSTDLGDSLVWTSRPLQAWARHVVSVGEDLRWVMATPREQLMPVAMKPSTVVQRSVSARQVLAGVFAEDTLVLSSRFVAALALRADYWSNRDAHSIESHADGSNVSADPPSRGGWELTPRLGVVGRLTRWLTVRGATYRAFRAPTFNELYRPFQVGTILTAPNASLNPETLWGGELGVEATTAHMTVRATSFANALLDPISNVTLPMPLADGSQRQRQNLGAAAIVGVEMSARCSVTRRWRLQAAYMFVDATVSSAPAQPELVGKQLAQDPRHRFSAALSFSERRWFSAILEVRYTGRQFDDDRNQVSLPGFAVVSARVSRQIVPHVDATLAIENLLNQQYLVGRSGVDTVGEPIFIYGGIRYRAQ